VPYRL